MGFPSATAFLDAISVADWFEWRAWAAIVGPVGPERWDYYVSYLAMQMGAPYPRGAAPKLSDFRMPWHPEPTGLEDDEEDDE